MSKKSMIARDKKRKKLIEQYKLRRANLKNTVKSSNDIDEVIEAQTKLAKLPRNSSSVRLTTRCNQCGRVHGVYRKFKLCRICLREQLMAGNIPGGRKSSW